MFDLRKIPILRALVPFFGGALTGSLDLSAMRIPEVLIISFALWVTAILAYLREGKRSGLVHLPFTVVLFLLFFLTGLGTGTLSRPEDPGLPAGKQLLIRGEIIETPRRVNNNHIFDMEVHLVGWEDSFRITSTILRTYFGAPPDSMVPLQGEIWQFSGTVLPVSNSGNPGSPDYRGALNRKNCWYYFYVSTGPSTTLSNRKIPFKGRRLSPELIRTNLSHRWHGGTEEISLLKAVCLGDRSSLTAEMRQDYKTAGGMHLLAVSGLHIGLIWWVLHSLTGWMSKLFRLEYQRIVIETGLLWFYAFITGFSSSVCRAVTMFTFFSITRMRGQRIHAVNGILVSSFLLVLIDPLKLMDTGFQLSYAAILGIVTLYPAIRKLLQVKKRILRWVWNAISVSLAAQLSTAPLVIYYFHQLPLYSMITSLVAVPLLSLLIAIFICSVPFISTGIAVEFFNFALVKLAYLMNRSMEYLSSLPGALLDGIQLDRMMLLIWILIILFVMIGFNSRSRVPWYPMLLLISCSLVWNSLTVLRCRSTSELVITHFNGASMVIVRRGFTVDHYMFCRDSSSLDRMKTYMDVAWSKRIYNSKQIEMGGIREAGGGASFCTELSDGIWRVGCCQYSGLVIRERADEVSWKIISGDSISGHLVQPGFILLSGEPDAGWLLDEKWRGDQDIVMDGSNGYWYIRRMKAEEHGIYLTDRSGAYVKRW